MSELIANSHQDYSNCGQVIFKNHVEKFRSFSFHAHEKKFRENCMHLVPSPAK